jgi:pyruvate/2-oxoglutarate dehydrogenase complex dihydrolipoamide acyltransferase (E2) component
MEWQHADYQVVPYPKYRRFAAAAYRSVDHKPMIHGLIEVDVTRARAVMRDHKAKTGESLSFTAFLATCLAKAVDEHKAVQAIRQGSKRLILFDDVDVFTNIERDVDGHKGIVPYIVRAANRKTFRTVHHEIRAAQGGDASHVLRQLQPLSWPAVLFRPFFWGFGWIASSSPRLWKQTVGTVELSAVGMFGTGAGWGIPNSAPTALFVTVGGIGEKQVIADGHATTREYLSLTISVDHNIVDGAPAARFAQRLKELIESGYGLDEYLAASDPAAVVGAPNQTVHAAYTPTREVAQ